MYLSTNHKSFVSSFAFNNRYQMATLLSYLNQQANKLWSLQITACHLTSYNTDLFAVTR